MKKNLTDPEKASIARALKLAGWNTSKISKCVGVKNGYFLNALLDHNKEENEKISISFGINQKELEILDQLVKLTNSKTYIEVFRKLINEKFKELKHV